MLAILALLVALMVLLGLLRFWNPRPEFPPLPVGSEHPKIRAAVDEARRRIDELRSHALETPERCLVKFSVRTSSDSIEHVWAELTEPSWPVLKVRLVTPPVTHDGKLERLHRKGLEDIEDWQVTFRDGTIVGGFTQRAMFEIAREEWGRLPRKLAKTESLYR